MDRLETFTTLLQRSFGFRAKPHKRKSVFVYIMYRTAKADGLNVAALPALYSIECCMLRIFFQRPRNSDSRALFKISFKLAIVTLDCSPILHGSFVTFMIARKIAFIFLYFKAEAI